LSSTTTAIALAVALGALAGCSQDKVIWLDRNDKSMDPAFAKARETLPLFWSKVDAGDPAITERLVKVGYPTTHGGIEYLWMDVLSHNAIAINGRLVNEPEDVPGVHSGQDVTIEPSKVADWSYSKGGKYFGQFTTRVLLEHSDPKTRREEGDRLAPTPLEPGDH
jgi:uncharacterized protein YegJ (DUF2314 family)